MTRVTSRLSILVVLGLTVQGISEQDRDVQIRDRYLASALKNPRRGTALEKLYQLALQTDGVDALMKQIRQHDGAPAVARWTLIGLLEETRGRDKDALAAFDKAVEASAESHYPAYRRGVVLLHRNDYAAAEKSLLGAMKAGPPRDDAIEIQKALGRCYLRSRQMAKAHKTWSTLAEIAPDDPMTLEELTRILVEEEQWDEALKYYERLRELQKDRPYHAVLCTIAMGKVEARRGRFPEALKRYEEALGKTKPDSWLADEIRLRIEELFRKRSDLSGLVQYYQERLEGPDAKNTKTMVALARLLTELGRDEDAGPWYAKAIELAPKAESVRLAYARVLENQSKPEEAIQHYEVLHEQKPKEQVYLETLGALHLAADEGPEGQARAREFWDRIAEANREDPATMIQVAGIYQGHAMHEDAEKYYKRAIELAPDVGQYREYYGEFLIERERRDEARRAFEQIAAGPRRSAETLMRLATVLDHFEFGEQAVEASREAVKRKPDSFEAQMQLVRLLSRKEEPDEALAQLDTAKRCAPNAYFRGQVDDTRIRLLLRADRLKETYAKRLEVLASSTDASSEAYVEAAKMALALGETAKAVEHVSRALKIAPKEVPAWELAARVYMRASDYPRRIAALERLVELAPQNRTEY